MKLDGAMELWRYLLVFCELAICLSSNRAAVITSLKLIYTRYIGSTIVSFNKTLHYRSRDYNTALNNLSAICLKA